MTDTTFVLVPLSNVEHLELHTTAHFVGEVSSAIGTTFNWAGHEILCDEEIPVWGMLRAETRDFFNNSVWGVLFSNTRCWIA